MADKTFSKLCPACQQQLAKVLCTGNEYGDCMQYETCLEHWNACTTNEDLEFAMEQLMLEFNDSSCDEGHTIDYICADCLETLINELTLETQLIKNSNILLFGKLPLQDHHYLVYESGLIDVTIEDRNAMIYIPNNTMNRTIEALRMTETYDIFNELTEEAQQMIGGINLENALPKLGIYHDLCDDCRAHIAHNIGSCRCIAKDKENCSDFNRNCNSHWYKNCSDEILQETLDDLKPSKSDEVFTLQEQEDLINGFCTDCIAKLTNAGMLDINDDDHCDDCENGCSNTSKEDNGHHAGLAQLMVDYTEWASSGDGIKDCMETRVRYINLCEGKYPKPATMIFFQNAPE